MSTATRDERIYIRPVQMPDADQTSNSGHRVDLYIDNKCVAQLPFTPPIGLWNRAMYNRWVTDFVIEALFQLLLGEGETLFGPRSQWATELAKLLDCDLQETVDRLALRPNWNVLAPLVSLPPPRTRKCALYRHLDSDGVLLYIGITSTPSGRGNDHAKGSAWVEFADRIVGQWLPSREEAIAAERKAIKEELPIFNSTHAAPGRHDRVRAYLQSKGRMDTTYDLF